MEKEGSDTKKGKSVKLTLPEELELTRQRRRIKQTHFEAEIQEELRLVIGNSRERLVKIQNKGNEDKEILNHQVQMREVVWKPKMVGHL